MIVKICGVKTLKEALIALEEGADMIGFNFYPPSPRSIDQQSCKAIMEEVKKRDFAALFVGVFVNETVEFVNQVLDECQLDLAQLSGDEQPQDLIRLGERAYKGLRIKDKTSAVREIKRYPKRTSPPAWLIDAFADGAYGGTGLKGDWEFAQKLAAENPILLAGGLTPDNVLEAIEHVKPWGVDVASGVESGPGCKDIKKMRLFIQKAKGGLCL